MQAVNIARTKVNKLTNNDPCPRFYTSLTLLAQRCQLTQFTTGTEVHCESKKTGPFSFEHNFRKYCLILINLSLLQTENKCNKVYHKIYHHASNLLVRYLVK